MNHVESGNLDFDGWPLTNTVRHAENVHIEHEAVVICHMIVLFTRFGGLYGSMILTNAAQELNVPPSTLREVRDQGICEPKGFYIGWLRLVYKWFCG